MKLTLEQSHSARSAWIETNLRAEEVEPALVALRKECVDLNNAYKVRDLLENQVALRKECVD